MRALIIDDEKAFAESVAQRLSLRGVQADAVFSAAEALARVTTPDVPVPDILFLDVHLGGDDGLCLLPRLLASCPDSDVVMLTGVTDMDAALQAMRQGARNWLKKPVNLDVVLEACHATETRLEHLHRQRRMAELDRQRLLGRVAEGVAHEVNNPLNIIMQAAGNVRDVLEAGVLPTDTAELVENLRLIHSQSLRVRSMMSRLLLVGGGLDPRAAAVDVAALLRSTLAEFAPRMKAQQVQCQLDVPEDMPRPFWSAQELTQVLRHVTENALDAMPQGGRLCLRVTLPVGQHSLLLHIEDSGVGIAPENLSAIFDPFFTTRDTGQGLGLAVCQSLMHMRGGSIQAEILPVGTRFTLTIPLESTAVHAAPPVAP